MRRSVRQRTVDNVGNGRTSGNVDRILAIAVGSNSLLDSQAVCNDDLHPFNTRLARILGAIAVRIFIDNSFKLARWQLVAINVSASASIRNDDCCRIGSFRLYGAVW